MMLPMMGGWLVAARGAAPVVARFGARAVISSGLVVLAFAALLGSRTSVHDGYGFTALWLSIAGVGFGFAVVRRWTRRSARCPGTGPAAAPGC